MRWSAEKLRWILLGGALLLAVVVAALFGLASYRAGKVWQRILARNGVNLQRETDGFTYSQSDGKRTVFTLHAAKAVPHGENRWSLRGAVLILYNKDGRTDRIYGDQFEYDQAGGTARALGEVHMDLEIPQAAGKTGQGGARPDLSFTPDDASAADPALIHVRTSGLLYTRKLGLATTDQPTEFRYKGLFCTSRGAEFDSGNDALRLLADVHLTGTLREAPFTLTAARAVLDREANTADLVRPEIVSDGKDAHAAHALLHLHRDGSLEMGDAEGGVVMNRGTETVSAPQMHATFGAESRPEHLRLFDNVSFTDKDARRPAQATARTADLSMNASGALSAAVAEGGVSVLVKETTPKGEPGSREMHAAKAVASFDPDRGDAKRSVLHTLHLLGAAEVAGLTPASTAGAAAAVTRVQADDLLTTFAPNPERRAEPQSLVGIGHTQMQQSGAEGAHQTGTGERLEVSFAQRPGSGANAQRSTMEVASAVQTGHVLLRSWPAVKKGAVEGQPTIGHAQQAVYTASAGTLTLTGTDAARAEVEDGATDLQAPVIVLHQGTGDGEASGGVVATTGGEGGAAATHILAARAALLHGADLSEFFGTDAQPAQLWQAGSQVQAARINLDGRQHTLAARPESAHGTVDAVFASAGSKESAAGAKAGRENAQGRRDARPGGEAKGSGHNGQLAGATVPEASRDSVQVRAAAMDYNDLEHEATFTGGVRMRGSEGEITGEHGAAFLATTEAGTAAKGKGTLNAHEGPQSLPGAPAMSGMSGLSNLGGRLERVVLMGDVHLKQPGRLGTGAQITYTAPTSSFVLTGTAAVPPQIRDSQQGVVTGATLLFGAADSSIVVAGTRPAGKHTAGTRVHTETDLGKQ